MQREPHDSKTLSIGEFAAATQLTPKALRLYDEHGLLRPARNTASGYRVYGLEQVAVGRLIRSLRDMNLSLAQIARVLEAETFQAEMLLREFLIEAEQRYARERRAYQAALGLLRHSRPSPAVSIEELSMTAQVVLVHGFSADRSTFIERYLAELHEARRQLLQLQQQFADWSACLLLEPLSQDESRLELVVPLIDPDRNLPLTTRTIPVRRYAAIRLPSADPSTLTAAVDALFDWFDRQGAFAVDTPMVRIGESEDARYRVLWAFESR
ncbi:MAG TPA: MerR family transcriptional regulator [Steroidobacter sp.]|uniref:MerR family transcriptional regulator n=1 Tax=Steroidobacter sp. TaxID=1978227 RepID=UPI002EDA0CF4